MSKKIFFNDKYGLTDAVLQGRKTMTRRLIPQLIGEENPDISDWGLQDGGKACICLYEGGRPKTDIFPAYQPGEVVAVAQSYMDAGFDPMRSESMFFSIPTIVPEVSSQPLFGWHKVPLKYHKGWNNKMYVRADLMPHQIRITNIKVERLQDISDEDCLREGVVRVDNQPKYMHVRGYAFTFKGWWQQQGRFTNQSDTPRGAFAALIDKVSGKGTWDKNPYVFAYSFELMEGGEK